MGMAPVVGQEGWSGSRRVVRVSRERFSCVLFDLDGTITDSAPGITATLAYTLERLGRPVPTPAELVAFVGPPILDGFATLGLDRQDARTALGIYRERYAATGAFDSALYPGVAELLRRLHDAGIPLGLATSKPESQALRILEHFGLLQLFAFAGGASEDEVRSAKADVVAHSLQNLAARGVPVDRPVLVGDREHDVRGAEANGVPTIFVTWGYGSVAERVGAADIVSSAAELERRLLPEDKEMEPPS